MFFININEYELLNIAVGNGNGKADFKFNDESRILSKEI